jgi:hypothetical protein
MPGATAAIAVAPSSGRNWRRVRPGESDFRSSVDFSDEAMMPPYKRLDEVRKNSNQTYRALDPALRRSESNPVRQRCGARE